MDVAGAAVVVATSVMAVNAWLFLRYASHSYVRRRLELALARDLLSTHFELADELDADPATPPLIRAFTELVVQTMGRKELATSVAARLRKRSRGISNASRSELHRKLAQAIESLNRENAELFDRFSEMLRTGVLAATLRWPETEDMAMHLAIASARSDFVPNGTYDVLDEAPDEYVQGLALAA
jgi:hypothetical protein